MHIEFEFPGLESEPVEEGLAVEVAGGEQGDALGAFADGQGEEYLALRDVVFGQAPQEAFACVGAHQEFGGGQGRDEGFVGGGAAAGGCHGVVGIEGSDNGRDVFAGGQVGKEGFHVGGFFVVPFGCDADALLHEKGGA